jgi:hypothetical protein
MKPPRCAATITPMFGRTVILEQSSIAAHGHPQPVRRGLKRRSVTAYFYTNGRTAASASNHLPTTYIAHKGYSRRKKIEWGLRLVVPPIILMNLKSARTIARRALRPARALAGEAPAQGCANLPDHEGQKGRIPLHPGQDGADRQLSRRAREEVRVVEPAETTRAAFE